MSINFPKDVVKILNNYVDCKSARDSYNDFSLISIWNNKSDNSKRKEFYSMSYPEGFESSYYDFVLFTDMGFKNLCIIFFTKYYPCPFCNQEEKLDDNEDHNIECNNPAGH